MDDLPVELIGDIMSRVGSARDVIRASVTSRKWHEAFRKHLHTLSFCSSDWDGYLNVPITQLEIMITKAILQTSGLQCLMISMDDVGEFSPSSVLCWIIYTKGSLRELYYNIKTNPSLNVLEKAGRQKLEVLELSHHVLTGIEPDILILPCLKCLVLSDVTISDCDLCFSINSCPKLESLELSDIKFAISDVGVVTFEITAPLLKRIHFESVDKDKIVLKVDKVEDLQLKECSIGMLDIIGTGTLKHLMIEDLASMHLNIGDSVENLETVDISNFYCISWPKFFKMISKSAKLQKLRLWNLMSVHDSDVVELESFVASFPMLSHLSLCYPLKDELLPCGQQVSGFMENVVFLRVGWSILSEKFADWVDGLLFLCPNLKVLVINGFELDFKDHIECQMLGRCTTSILRVMQKYSNVDIRFEFDEF